MLNVKTLTDTMSRMQLPELQQYATLHKNDPYIVTLALSIANQKKQMKAGQAGQAGMQPQPKVADQQIAQMVAPPPQQGMAAAPQQETPAVDAMGNVTGYAGGGYLPEDQGIGQLPAQNMQNMAEGGIVAFDDGGTSGSVFGDMYTDDPAEMARRKLLAQQRAQTQAQDQRPPVGIVNANTLVNAPTQADLAKRKADAEAILKESPEDYAYRKIAELEALGGKKLSPDARNKAMSDFVKDKMTGQIKRGEASYTKDNQLPTPATTYVDPNKPLTGLTPPGQKSLIPANQPTNAAPSADADYMSGIDKLLKSSQMAGSMGPKTQLDAKRYSLTPAEMANIQPEDFVKALESAMPKNPTASPFDAQQQELNKANLATRQNAKTEMEKHFKEQGLAFTDTFNKLTSKEKRVQTMEDNQLGMSMLEAGLNMMAGESPYAMVNIGKGAQAGTKKYMEIQNQVESYRDKIDETKMKIEEYRRNEANMNARELRAAQRDIDDSVSTGAQSMINLAREQYGLNKQQAISFVSNSMQIQQFNVNQKNQIGIHNQTTAAGIDTAYAQMANQRAIQGDQARMQLGIHALEAKYRAANPAAGSIGFYKYLGDGDAKKGMKVYSESLGPEAKGIEADILAWSKASEPEKMTARKFDPMGSAQKDRLLRERLIQSSAIDKPAGTVLDQPR